jgi:hypothetical protein
MDLYYKDLERGIDVIQNKYNFLLKEGDMLKEECKLIDKIMYSIGLKE